MSESTSNKAGSFPLGGLGFITFYSVFLLGRTVLKGFLYVKQLDRALGG
ncbi:MAG: hypothetical protein P8K79_01640 [Mariniblastus sp.]|nr:hypothetical protein [Mariniblastus sp.]